MNTKSACGTRVDTSSIGVLKAPDEKKVGQPPKKCGKCENCKIKCEKFDINFLYSLHKNQKGLIKFPKRKKN